MSRKKSRFELRVTGDEDGTPVYTVRDLYTREVHYEGHNQTAALTELRRVEAEA